MLSATGTIPKELGNIEELRRFRVDNNKFVCKFVSLPLKYFLRSPIYF